MRTIQKLERSVLVLGVAGVAGLIAWLAIRDHLRAPAPDGPLTVARGTVKPGEHGGYFMYLRYRPPLQTGAPVDDLDALRLRIKTVCRVGDAAMTDNGLWIGMEGMRDPSLPDGVDENIAFSFYELPARPDRCQVELHVDRGLTDTGEVHTFCLDRGEEVAAGPCAPPVVSKAPPGPDPLVSEVTARPDEDGDLVVSWTTTAARPPTPGLNVDVIARCRMQGGGERTSDGGCSDGVDQLAPGESVRCGQILFRGAAGDHPASCDLSFLTSMRATPSSTPFATFCADVAAATVRPGGC